MWRQTAIPIEILRPAVAVNGGLAERIVSQEGKWKRRSKAVRKREGCCGMEIKEREDLEKTWTFISCITCFNLCVEKNVVFVL
jgi:hypothetical protein